jgi:hypothetical protein
MRNLQKAGGVSALISAASYVFAIGLYLTLMLPLADTQLGIDGYVAFFAAHRALAFAWTFSMYIVHGLSLVVLVLALHERLKDGSPRLSLVASSLGMIWAAFVLLSGFINIWGSEALVALYGNSRDQAEAFRNALTIITLGIDSSDKLLGSLWLGLASLAAFRTRTLPKVVSILGLAIGAAALLIGLILPVNDSSASFLFGVGAIVWWIALGVHMLRKPRVGPMASRN